MSLHGWIIYNGNLPGQKFLDFAQWFHYAAEERNLTTTIYKNNELLSLLTEETFDLIHQKNDLPDFVIFTDKDIYLAKQLEILGIPVFNSAKSIAASDDKIATYQVLSQKQLPIPQTIIAPKIFTASDILDLEFLTNVVRTIGFPMIIKEAFGSFGEQVYLIHTTEELKSKVKSLSGKAFVFQQFISTSYGKDIRLHVVGDQVVAAMLRKSAYDFRANITTGGTMEVYRPNAKEKELAIKATQAIEADFAGVDILFGPGGQPILCEVNSNAHIRNMYDCTGINVAEFVINYIINVLNLR